MTYKITIIGDGTVGKTSIYWAFTKNEFHDNYEPTIFDNTSCSINVDGSVYDLVLWDTAGQEDYARLRPLSYQDTDCFLLCFALNNRTSFENIKSKWIPEIRNFSKVVPIVLIGTKSDLRPSNPNAERFVLPVHGLKLRREVAAYTLIECSAKELKNIDEIFVEAVRSIINRNINPNEGEESKESGSCFSGLRNLCS